MGNCLMAAFRLLKKCNFKTVIILGENFTTEVATQGKGHVS